MLNVLETIRYPLCELLHAGSKVTIVHHHTLDYGEQEDTARRFLTTQCGTRVSNPETNFFQLSADEWTNVCLPCVTLQASGLNNSQEKISLELYGPSRYLICPDDANAQEKVKAALLDRWGKSSALEGFDHPWEGYAAMIMDYNSRHDADDDDADDDDDAEYDEDDEEQDDSEESGEYVVD